MHKGDTMQHENKTIYCTNKHIIMQYYSDLKETEDTYYSH